MNEFFAMLEESIKKIFDIISGLIAAISSKVGAAE